MIEILKKLKEGKVEEIEDNYLYPLMIWNSGWYKNIPQCNFINKYFFYVNPKILIGLLSLTIDKREMNIKYPKGNMVDDKKMKIIEPYLKKIYNWSEREFNFQEKIITRQINEKWLEELNKRVGFSKEECKTLGIEFKKFKVEKPKDLDSGDLFNWR